MTSGLGNHPADIKRRYSWPLLNLLYDSHWWASYSPPFDDEGGGSSGGGRGKPKHVDARRLDDDQLAGLFS